MGRLFARISIAALFSFLLSSIFIISGFMLRKNGEDYFQNITIQSEDICFPEEQLLSLIPNESPFSDQKEDPEQHHTATAWTERKEEIITDSSSGRSSKTNIIAIFGPSYCLLPFGKNLSSEDSEGCLISRSLAEKLFGDFPAEDQQIVWNNNNWTVRGVIPLSTHCLIVETADKNMDLSYNRISIPLEKSKDRRISGENFIVQNNLSAQVLRLDYLYHWSWMQELIPSQWSDFDSWKQNWTDHIQTAERVEHAERSTLEAKGLEIEYRGCLLQLVGILLCMGSILLIWKKTNFIHLLHPRITKKLKKLIVSKS